jgi:hypothetical protein
MLRRHFLTLAAAALALRAHALGTQTSLVTSVGASIAASACASIC